MVVTGLPGASRPLYQPRPSHLLHLIFTALFFRGIAYPWNELEIACKALAK